MLYLLLKHTVILTFCSYSVIVMGGLIPHAGNSNRNYISSFGGKLTWPTKNIRPFSCKFDLFDIYSARYIT